MAVSIEIRNAGFQYAGTDSRPVFREVSFTLSQGEVFCLLGPNGSGKSTLLKCLSGLLSVTEGGVLLEQKNIRGFSAAQRARAVGYVPQSLTPAFPFRVLDVVVMGRAAYLTLFASPSEKDIAVAMAALEKIGILHLSERPCNRISGGEWQLVLIARALTQNPTVLLLDEPTSHLDLGNQMKILSVVRQLAEEGLAIAMASHFPDHAFLCGDRVALLKDRALMKMGPPQEVITARSMKEMYGVDVEIITMKNGTKRKVCVPMIGETRG
jgi:iron complex transport system ATP-binding protein